MKKLQLEINSVLFISLTSDCWTASTSNSSFISFTAHWINDNYELRCAILQVTPFNDKHTAVNICENILNTMQKFNLSSSKVHLVVRDNAANMAAGITQANLQSLPCFTHTLQLVLNDAIFEQRYVKDIIAVCKQIVGHFHHSPSAFAKYQEYQKQFKVSAHRFIQDVQTRWNSHYQMMNRILEQKAALIAYCSDHSKPACLESSQWKVLEKLQKILKNFEDCANFMSTRDATAALIIPNIKVIRHFFESAESNGLFSGLGSTLSSWKSSVELRLSSYINDKNLILATFLDPRFKDKFIEQEYNGKPADEALAVWLSEDLSNSIKYSHSETASLPDSSDSAGSDDEQNVEFNFSFEKCFSDIKRKKKADQQGTSNTNATPTTTKSQFSAASIKIRTEISRYLTFKLIANNENPLNWWKANKEELPSLALLSRKYLCAPPSSVESERIFSVGGNIYSPKRNRLEPTTGEMLMFLHYNLRVLQFDYD